PGGTPARTGGRSGPGSPAPAGRAGPRSDGSSPAERRIRSFRREWATGAERHPTGAAGARQPRGGRGTVSLGNGGGPSDPPRLGYSLLKGVSRGLYSPKTPLGFGYQIHT